MAYNTLGFIFFQKFSIFFNSAKDRFAELVDYNTLGSIFFWKIFDFY